MKLPSLAPLLISCPLPLVPITQQPAGSFHERTASHISFQQSCPPDFPMPDIWNRYCAGQIDLHSFAPARLTSCFGWNRPLIFGPVPAENVSGLLHKPAKATPRIRKTFNRGAGLPHCLSIVSFRPALIGQRAAPAIASQLNKRSSGPDYRRKSITE